VARRQLLLLSLKPRFGCSATPNESSACAPAKRGSHASPSQRGDRARRADLRDASTAQTRCMGRVAEMRVLAWKRDSAPTRRSSRRFEHSLLLSQKRAVGPDRCRSPIRQGRAMLAAALSGCSVVSSCRRSVGDQDLKRDEHQTNSEVETDRGDCRSRMQVL
jgi:hypothetical protein